MPRLKKLTYGVIMALAFTSAVAIAAQEQLPGWKSTDVTVTGCVTQGSQSTIFVLDNARVNPSDPNEKGKQYLLTSVFYDEAPVKDFLNHEVTITGTAIGNNPTLPGAEGSLDIITAKSATSLTSVADRCIPSGR